ncbi:MAG TPA: hypothetical protein VGX76_15885, partial [Pirellulales bacterium]|nr:hypothetical protein [Pirellulales bacterium]
MVRRLVCWVVKNGVFGAAVLGASVVLPCATCSADALRPTAPARERTHDQLWIVSCRGAAFSAADEDSTRLHYLAYRPTGIEATGPVSSPAWQTATSEDFIASGDTRAITCVLVLGNGYTASETQAVGQKAYRHLVAGLAGDTAVRFVVWSWPSDHADTGPIKDLRIKAGRTWQVARSLSRWVDDIEPTGGLSLLGTSFGARIVMEALELRAATSTDGGSPSLSRPPTNVVLISAAVDNDWLLPGRRLDMALSQVDQLLLVNNTSDRVLKRYHWLYGRRSTATALGNSGLPVGVRLGPAGEKVTQYDAASIVGRQHGCSAYFESPRLVALMRKYLFPIANPAEPPSVPDMPPVDG